MANNSGVEAISVINHMKKKGSLKVVIIGLSLGITLLLIGGFIFADNKNESNEKNDNSSPKLTFYEYKEGIRCEIETICLEVQGVNSAYAVVFFDGVGERLYAQNIQTGNTEKSEYVIIGSGSGAHALYIGESLPQLSGIGVVCDTGGNDSLKNELVALLSAAYGLPLTRIYVSEG